MIDFSQPGWFRAYITLRKENPFRLRHPELEGHYYLDDLQAEDLGHAHYFALQSTGLLYGFPVQPPSYVPPANLKTLTKVRERTAFIFLECMFASLLIHYVFQKGDTREYEELLDDVAETVKSYYIGIQPGFLDLKKVEEGFEDAFMNRLKTPEKFYKRARFGINTLLFWDVFYLTFYHEAIKVQGSVPATALDIIQDFLTEMKVLTLETIVVAAHSSQVVEPEEEALFNQFLNSSGLNDKHQKRLKKHLKDGALLEDLKFPALPWLAKRYLLDTSLLTVMSDQRLSQSENDYLKKLTHKLGLEESELEESQAALGIFMLRYGEFIPFIQKRPNPFALLRSTVKNNAKKLLGAVLSESVETKEMAVTFGKVLSTKLRIRDREDLPSAEEIKAAMDQLKEIPRFAPFFGIIFMPVPGITELYLLLAITIEKMSDNKVQLLPTNFSKMLKKDEDEVDWE